MARKYESPSSINTYKQCPRKYYYSYIAKYPRLPSIHLIRGNVAHTVLEHFYDISDEDLDKIEINDYEIVLRTRIKILLKSFWFRNIEKFRKLDLSNDQHLFYFRETQEMLHTWIGIFIKKLKMQIEDVGNLRDAFRLMVPVREKEFVSEAFKIRGFIDVIEDINNKL